MSYILVKIPRAKMTEVDMIDETIINLNLVSKVMVANWEATLVTLKFDNTTLYDEDYVRIMQMVVILEGATIEYASKV